jgi:peptidyl-prolyl cis-trans isomerase B (cyclophilin B)
LLRVVFGRLVSQFPERRKRIQTRDFFGVTALESRVDLPGMKHPHFSLLLACTLSALALASAPAADKEVAVLKTSGGEMVVEFWPDVAPNTVANFIKLAKSGFYDGTAFHRIIKGFMIQGGDPLTKDPSKEARWGTGGAGEHIKAEFNERRHELGVISMARSQDPDSASSQFFICLGPTPQLDGKYTAFGKLLKGEDVLRKLGDSAVGPTPDGRENSRPTSRIVLESVKVVPADSIK